MKTLFKIQEAIYKGIVRVEMSIWNFIISIRIKLWAYWNDVHRGTKRILIGGVWIDDNNNLYNCLGKKIGKIDWNK